ncbi:MAG: dihydroneopterin aldolase [Bacillota bacterium]
MDKILISGMRFYGRHGVLAQEKDLGQTFEADIELSLDLRPAGLSDDLTRTVSYAEVFGLVKEVVAGDPANLIEAVAERVAALVLERYGAVQEVRVRLKKPSAPIEGIFDFAGVEIIRARSVISG